MIYRLLLINSDNFIIFIYMYMFSFAAYLYVFVHNLNKYMLMYISSILIL